MKRLRLNNGLFVVVIGFGCLSLIWWYTTKPIPLQRPTEHRVQPYAFSGSSIQTTIETVGFVTPETIQRGIQTKRTLLPCKSYKAGIVNHHTLASDLLATSALQLKTCKPHLKTLIIVSPDHFYRGATEFSTTQQSYRVGERVISSHFARVEELLQAIPSMRINDVLFKGEHGVGAVLPYYVTQYPNIDIVPIAIKGRVEQDDRNAFQQWLREQLKKEDVFVLVSADMSHYLSKERAWDNDKKTIQALESNDAKFFAEANDDYVDSGMQLAMVIGALDGALWETHHHVISSEYSQDRDNTTTYITGFWY